MLMEDSATIPSLRIVLWSVPRSLSTVFTRSIRELEGVEAIFEPHIYAYYNGPEKKFYNGEEVPVCLKPDATFKAADETLLQSYPGYKAIFFKNHGFYVNHNCKHYTTGKFSNFKHTFLIRNPHKSIPSLFKACKESGLNDNNNGFRELYEMYETVRLNVDPHPLVIDADNLLADPKGIMQQYCEATGLTFNEKMLNWIPGIIDDWIFHEQYERWVGAAMKSSGFLKPDHIDEKSLEAKVAALPQEIRDVIDKALPFYEALYKVRTISKCSACVVNS